MKNKKKLDVYYSVVVKYNSIVRVGPLQLDQAYLSKPERTLARKPRRKESLKENEI